MGFSTSKLITCLMYQVLGPTAQYNLPMLTTIGTEPSKKKKKKTKKDTTTPTLGSPHGTYKLTFCTNDRVGTIRSGHLKRFCCHEYLDMIAHAVVNIPII